MGQWHAGKRHGKGLRTWKDDREYIGNWDNNKRTGNVQRSFMNVALIHRLGITYLGEW